MDTSNSGQQTSKDSSSVREIFLRALDKPNAQARADFLDGACGSNEALRTKVEALLEKKPRDDGFLEKPAIEFERVADDELSSSECAGTMVDRFKLLERLGEGGFGTVWVAEQKDPVKRRVALKIIKLGMDTKQVVARFEAERQALAMMDHPNIAKVHDAGATETGRPYFVMELVNGIPITDYCEKEKLDTKGRLDLFIKVCHAVQHAHQKGIIHRDIKPSNILVESHDGVPVPKVIDFGIAKATHQELTEKTIYTKFQEFIGTPSYMSPEQTQLSGLDIDTRSDVYSLGVLLYELLTGSTPFDSKALLASGFDEMRKIIREKEPVRPSTRLSQLRSGTRENRREAEIDEVNSEPRQSSEVSRLPLHLATDLDWIVMKCLEKERTRRYDTATGLATDLVRHLKHEPIVARPPSKSYRLQKSWQRNKLIFTAGAAVALALLAGIAASTWQVSVATRAKMELQHNLARQLLLRAQALCEQGKIADGLHWMVRAHEETPAPSQALRRDIQDNLVAWSQQWVETKAHLLHNTTTTVGSFSPDSQRVITGSWNGDLTLWSVPTGKLLWRVNTHEGKQIYAMRFSSDGTRILSRGGDKKVRLWSTGSGEQLGQAMDGGSARFNSDGQSVFVRVDRNTARMHSALTGEPLAPPRQLEDKNGERVFGPDGRFELIGGADSTRAIIWDIDSAQPMEHVLDGAPSGKIGVVDLGPRGEKVGAGCEDGSVHVWSVTTGKRLFVRHHKKRIQAAVFHPDGDRLLTAGDDGTARLWNTETGDQVGDPMQHDAVVWDASFSPDGRRIVTASLDAYARLWSAETAEPLGRPLRHQDNWVMAASFSPDNKHILTLTGAQVSYLWDATETDVPIRMLDTGEGTSTARFSPRGRWVATGNHYRRSGRSGVKIFDPVTRDRVAQDIVHSRGVWSVCFSPDGRYLATGGGDGKARIWDVETHKERFHLEHANTVRRVTYSADGKLIATGSFDGTARIWSASEGEPLSDSLPHPGFVEDVAFGENEKERFLVTACADGLARIWSVGRGKEILPPFEHGAALLTVDVSPNNELIATGGHDKIVKLWKVSDGNPTGIVLVHDGSVQGVTFSKNGRWLLTTSRDATVRLWSVGTGEQIGPSLLNDPSAGPWESCFSPDEKQVAIADHQNGTIMVELPGPLDQPHSDPRLWIEVITRMEMDEHGTLTSIEPDAWRAKSEQLAALGDSPVPQRKL